jgi:NADH:ubiquinone oxidoreductase subunit 4 (subunit M)
MISMLTLLVLFPSGNRLKSNVYWLMLLSCLVISSLGMLCYPLGVSYVSLYTYSWSSSYVLMLGMSKFGLVMSWLLDFLVLLCFFYGYVTRYSGNVTDDIALMLLYWCSAMFFVVDDVLLLSLLYECQMVPLLWMMFSRYGILGNINNSGITMSLSHSKGLGQAMYLLIWYGLVSGAMLYIGWYKLYGVFGTTSLFELSSLLWQVSELSNDAILGCTLVFLSGAVKLSLCPFHVWLGKVHVECSTVGSVLLAAISLKTGFYLHVMIWPSLYSAVGTGVIVDVLCLLFLLGGMVSSFSLFNQVDAKRWVALYSVSHMNLFYLLLFGCIRSGQMPGGVLDILMQYGMLGHSLVAAGLFFLIGSLCDRHGTRALTDLSGMVSSWEAVCLLVLLCANSGFPLLVLFIYEVLGYLCLMEWDILLSILCGGLSSLCMLSSMLVYSRLAMVGRNVSANTLGNNGSVTIMICVPICILCVLLGLQCVYPIYNLC